MPLQPADTAGVHVIACGALVRELRSILPETAMTFLPAPLHNTPDRIVEAVEEALASVDPTVPVIVGYGDCGTGGHLDLAIERWRNEGRTISRLPGAHCYEFFTGSLAFADLAQEELGTFYLTDFLARHFELLVWQGLGLARHPELVSSYFGQYRRLVHLMQSDDPATVEELTTAARFAADRLGLSFEQRITGLGPFEHAVELAGVG